MLDDPDIVVLSAEKEKRDLDAQLAEERNSVNGIYCVGLLRRETNGVRLRFYLLGSHRRTTMQRREEENCFMHSRVLFSGLDNDIRHANLWGISHAIVVIKTKLILNTYAKRPDHLGFFQSGVFEQLECLKPD